MESLSQLQNEIDELSSKQADLETEVQHDVMKLEAVKFFQKLNEVRDELENKTTGLLFKGKRVAKSYPATIHCNYKSHIEIAVSIIVLVLH